MAKAGQAQDTSMEDILASIRKIIADDDEQAKAERQPRLAVVETQPPPESEEASEEPEAGPATASDIWGARQAAAAPPRPAAEDARRVSPPVIEDVGDRSLHVPPADFRSAHAAEPERPYRPVSAQSPAVAPAERPLLSPEADQAVKSAFGQLASAVPGTGGRTLEDLAREMMRPMLRDWLDDNLPPLVERLVREEIERVSRGRR